MKVKRSVKRFLRCKLRSTKFPSNYALTEAGKKMRNNTALIAYTVTSSDRNTTIVLGELQQGIMLS